jgi:hypothetical protein
MSSTMSQNVQCIIDANAPMVFTYAYSRPEIQRIAHPIHIKWDIVSTIDTETGKYKKFKLDGIIFPKYEPSTGYISYMIEEGLNISFYYSDSDVLMSGVPIRFSKDCKEVLVRLETYLPYRRYCNQIPSYVEHKYFTISVMKDLKSDSSYLQTLPENVLQTEPEWMRSSEWFPIESENVGDTDEEDPLEVELIDITPYLTDEMTDEDDENDHEPSSGDDECSGCRYDMANQQAHYGGCIQGDF